MTKALGALVALALVAPLLALAQSVAETPAATVESPPPAETAGPRRVGIEEIVVTAQKREENMQDVPISIQAFGGEELDARGVLNPQELQRITPGLVYDYGPGGFSIIYIRGVGSDAFLPGNDLSVATYVDGVYFPVAHGNARELDEVERIEVLKGPQGTLFGRNSTGGAINIVTREPSDELTASMAGTFGNLDENRLKAFVSGPLPFGFSFSASGLYGRRDDYYDVHPASVVREFPNETQKGARLKLRWAPFEIFDATAAAQLLDSNGLGTALNNMLEPSPLSNVLGITAKPDRQGALDVEPFQRNRMRVAYLTTTLHPRWFDVKNIVSYQEVRNRAQFDFDGSEMPIVGFYTTKPLFGDSFTEELQILSNENTPFADWLEWIAGFYFIKSSAGFKRLDVTVGDLPELTALGFPDLALPGVTNATVGLVGILDTLSPAGFFQGTLRPLDWVDVTFGGRYLTEKREIRRNSSLLDVNGNVTPLFVFPDRERDDSNLSPKAVLSVRPLEPFGIDVAEELMTYFSWSKGFKSGTYNILNINEPGDEVESEEVTTYELGVKSEFLDGRVRANGALFRNEIKDLQSQFISLLSGGTTNLDNAGEATIEGFELEVIAGLLRDLYLNIGATYLDGVYDDFRNASGFDPQTGLFTTNVDNTGNTIVRTPEWTVSSGLVYTLDVWRGVVEAGADVYYNSGYFFDTQNTAEQPSYWLANARLGYLYEPWNLRVTGYGLNVNEADYYLTKFVADFGVTGKLALPATYGVRIDWQFG